ncbi:hypothetical protein QBC46DRAFT_75120 [Diplogelasinospora grovesii]|uniref:Uncharacterized protein n=1 Tax=Diplogelasinospora grovesii TaxID=303347 RepID=A0AAN6NCB1_9PEZI|nr:hypothetical protein QBC46DRAFT_75120 [Diplogelasinospora grovesii]
MHAASRIYLSSLWSLLLLLVAISRGVSALPVETTDMDPRQLLPLWKFYCDECRQDDLGSCYCIRRMSPNGMGHKFNDIPLIYGPIPHFIREPLRMKESRRLPPIAPPPPPYLPPHLPPVQPTTVELRAAATQI